MKQDETPLDYELMVQSLLAAKLKADGLTKLSSFHLKKYVGKSGQEHEIDVSYEVDIAGLRLLFLIECKQYRRRVGVDELMTFSYRMKDLGAHKGVLVTAVGFQEGAVKVAKAEGIGLLVAANGKIVRSWAGYMGQQYQYWIKEFVIEASPQGNEVSLIGEREVVCNQTCMALSYKTIVDDSEPVIAFLLPEEENWLNRVPEDEVLGRYDPPSTNGFGKEINEDAERPRIV